MDQTNRFNRDILNNRAAMTRVSNSISTHLKRGLTQIEVRDLFNFAKSNATQNWRPFTDREIEQILVKNFITRRFTERGRAETRKDNEFVDIHEIMKGHIGTADQDPDYDFVNNVDTNGFPARTGAEENKDDDEQLGSLDTVDTVNVVSAVTRVGNLTSFLGKSDEASIQRMLNPQASIRKNYIILDTRYKSASSNGQTTFSWNFLNNSTNVVGGVNSIGGVKSVTAIQCPSIRIPYKESVFISSYKRVTMLINELSGQSYIGQEGARFHFMFKAEIDGNMIELTPVPSYNNEGVFKFTKPITQLDTITISFGNPLQPIIFDADTLLMAVQYTNPVGFVATVPHTLQTGDQVYVTAFTTNDPTADSAAIATINRSAGYNIVVTDDYSFQIDGIDFSALTAPIIPYNINIYFGSKRIFVPLTLEYIYSPTSSTL